MEEELGAGALGLILLAFFLWDLLKDPGTFDKTFPGRQLIWICRLVWAAILWVVRIARAVLHWVVHGVKQDGPPSSDPTPRNPTTSAPRVKPHTKPGDGRKPVIPADCQK